MQDSKAPASLVYIRAINHSVHPRNVYRMWKRAYFCSGNDLLRANDSKMTNQGGLWNNASSL